MSWFEYEPEALVDDPGFLRLKPEPALLFVLLTHRSMRHGHLTPDREFYRMLWGARFRRFDHTWDAVQPSLTTSSDGLLCFEWVDEMRSSMVHRMKHDRERKKNTRMQAREVAMSSGHPSDVQKSSRLQTNKQTNRPTNDVGAASAKPPRVVDGDGSKPAPIPHYREAIEVWCQCFQKVTGQSYGFNGGVDGKHVKAILTFAGGDLAVIHDRAMILLRAAPGWIDSGGKDLGTLRSQWNKLVSQQTGTATGAKVLAMQAVRHTAENLPVGLLDIPTTNGRH